MFDLLVVVIGLERTKIKFADMDCLFGVLASALATLEEAEKFFAHSFRRLTEDHLAKNWDEEFGCPNTKDLRSLSSPATTALGGRHRAGFGTWTMNTFLSERTHPVAAVSSGQPLHRSR